MQLLRRTQDLPLCLSEHQDVSKGTTGCLDAEALAPAVGTRDDAKWRVERKTPRSGGGGGGGIGTGRVGALPLLLVALDVRRVHLFALFERVFRELRPARVPDGHPARVKGAVEACVLAGEEELLGRDERRGTLALTSCR